MHTPLHLCCSHSCPQVPGAVGVTRLLSGVRTSFLLEPSASLFPYLSCEGGSFPVVCSAPLYVCKFPVGLPRWLSGKESACQCRKRGLDPWVRKISCRRKWQTTTVFLPGESHGQRSPMYSPWDSKESDTTEYASAKWPLSLQNDHS